MGLKTSLPAKQYFKRRGVLFLVAGLLVAAIGVLAAPDAFGRIFAGIITALLVTRGVLSLRRAKNVSERAVVHEHLHGRSVGYSIDEPRDEAE